MLTNRIGGLAQQAGAFEFLCFIDNHDTDTQVRPSCVCFFCVRVVGIASTALTSLAFKIRQPLRAECVDRSPIR